MDDALRLDRIADAANRAVTSFYTIYARAIAADQTPNGKPPAGVGERRAATRHREWTRCASSPTTPTGWPVTTIAALDGAADAVSRAT